MDQTIFDRKAEPASGTRNAGSRSERSALGALSDRELLARITTLVKTEHKAVLSMLIHIVEVEARGLDLSSGYSSIFDFCVRALGYSESVANRRIRAARAIRDFPAVYDHLAAGKVNICNVSKIAGIMTRENHIVLLGQISGRPTREVDMIVSSHRPATMIRDRVTPVRVIERVEPEAGGSAVEERDEGTGHPAGGKKFTASAGGKDPCSAVVEVRQKFKLQFAVSPGFMDKYERVKELLSTRRPGGMDLECLFEVCLDEYIERHSPEARERRRARRRAKAGTPAVPVEIHDGEEAVTAGPVEVHDSSENVSGGPVEGHGCNEASDRPVEGYEASGARRDEDVRTGRRTERSRHIPAVVRDRVYKRDGGACTYRGPDGRRCGSRWNLEIDHIVPFTMGGSNSPDNLQLLCRRHNQHKGARDPGIPE